MAGKRRRHGEGSVVAAFVFAAAVASAAFGAAAVFAFPPVFAFHPFVLAFQIMFPLKMFGVLQTKEIVMNGMAVVLEGFAGGGTG